MRLAIFGGTFNPPHHGHLGIAGHVLKETEFTTVLFVPTHIPAHKERSDQVSASDRLEMTRLMCNADDALRVDSCDIERGGVSYSIDTVADVLRRYEVSGRPGFVLGDDLVEGFASWHRVDEFVKQVELLVAHRQWPEEVELGFPHRYLSNPLVSVSSSDIRRRVAKGLPIDGLVTEAVKRYISDKGLYACSESPPSENGPDGCGDGERRG